MRRGIYGTFRQLYRWQGQPEQRVYRDGRHVGFKLEIETGRGHGQLSRIVVSGRVEGKAEGSGRRSVSESESVSAARMPPASFMMIA